MIEIIDGSMRLKMSQWRNKNLNGLMMLKKAQSFNLEIILAYILQCYTGSPQEKKVGDFSYFGGFHILITVLIY